MNYQQTIDYLYTQLPMFSRVGPAAYKANLDNTLALCKLLNNPENKFKSIHVGGTNGKGSVSHMLAAVLQSAGYKTGLYTSPHLKDFRERIKVDGQMIEQQFVVGFVHKLDDAIKEIEPSFFEITVAMAFEYFAQQQVDIAVIEVGLGGRLDSTNVILPEVSIITNIGRDHMNILGDTLQKIASEKAGIIKPGVPVIIGQHQAEVAAIFEDKAKECGAPLLFADKKKWVAEWQLQHQHLNIAVADSELDDEHKRYSLDLPGVYQLKNVLPVLACVELLRKNFWQISEEHVREGLANVKKLTGLQGRWQMLRQQPAVIVDVAHNVDGVMQLTQQLELMDYEHLHMVVGFVKDKEVEAILPLLPQQATYYFTKAQIPRALPEQELAAMASKFNLHGTAVAEVNEAIQAALARAQANDLILVCGSVFLVGEVR